MQQRKTLKPPATKWIGVDFDGTLVHEQPDQPRDYVGPPVTDMVERVRRLLAAGVQVRILTARVSHPFVEYAGTMPSPKTDEERRDLEEALAVYKDAMKQKQIIEAWCRFYFKTTLPVTCVKDRNMSELWDDRAVQVAANLGLLTGTGSRYTIATNQDTDDED